MFKDIIYKPSTVKELIDSQKLAFKFGWGNEVVRFTNLIESYYIIFSIDKDTNVKSVFRISSRSFDTLQGYLNYNLQFNDGDYVYFDNFNDFSKHIKNVKRQIDYNRPKKLVYESVNDDIGKCVIYKPLTDSDLIESQEFLYENNYVCNDSWNDISEENIEIVYKHKTSDLYLLFIDKDNQAFCNVESDDYDTIEELFEMTNVDINIFELITDNLSLLKNNIMGRMYINYNEPKKLVYESKILKYNDFKNG